MKTLTSLPTGLSGVRVRFQRTQDARFFAGWVTDTTSTQVNVRPGDEAGLSPGDTFMVELYAMTYNLLFEAKLQVMHKGIATLDMQGSIRCIAPREPVRVSMQDAMCRVAGIGDSLLAQVIDISPNSIAINSPRELTPSQWVTLTVETWAGTVDGEGKVIYCKRQNGMAEPFRIALTFEPHTRLAASAWSKLFDSAS